MLRFSVGLVVVSACGFTNMVEDELVEEGMDPTPTPPTPTALKCNAADKTGMVLCVDFEDAPAFGDFFGAVTAAQGVDPMDRLATEQAARFTDASLYTIEAAPKFNVPRVTIEMWTRPAIDPGGMSEQGLFEYYLGYAMTYEGGSKIECSVGGYGASNRVEGRATLSVGAWHHVACTYDGSQLRVYVDGQLEGCGSITSSTANFGVHGGAIGAQLPFATTPTYANHFVGQLDNVRVYSRALSAEDVCSIATGGTSCSKACPRDRD